MFVGSTLVAFAGRRLQFRRGRASGEGERPVRVWCKSSVRFVTLLDGPGWTDLLARSGSGSEVQRGSLAVIVEAAGGRGCAGRDPDRFDWKCGVPHAAGSDRARR